MRAKSENNLKIAMLGHKRVPSREGGVEIVVEELSTRMAALGHSVTCFNRAGHHVSGKQFDNKKLKEYKGVRLKSVITLDFKGLAAMTSSFFAALGAAFGRYDVVHFHAEGPCAMLPIPKLFGKRCIATVHGLDHRRAKWGRFAEWYIKLGEKCAVKYADEIIVLSREVRDYFLETYGRETVYIPNGASAPQRQSPKIITEKFNLTNDSYILFLGRLVPEKGVHYLISAFGEIKTDKRLVIAGGSSDTAEYEQQLRALAATDKRIIFTGFVEGDELSELYSNAYLYILPSDLEGMPLSLMEAMSYGNACLVSDIDECVQVISHDGFTFKRGDVDDLKKRLEGLISNTSAVETKKSVAAQSVLSRFDWDEITQKTLALYTAKTEIPKKEKVKTK